MTGEHPVSRGIFASSSGVYVRSLGKAIGLDAFTINILCKTHNNALSVVDKEGIRAFHAITEMSIALSAAQPGSAPLRYAFDGPLLERWFLKTFINLVIRDARDLRWLGDRAGDDPPHDLVQAAFGGEALSARRGLYEHVSLGNETHVDNTVGLAVMAREAGISHGRFDFQAIRYVLSVDPEPIRVDAGSLLYRNDTSEFESPTGRAEWIVAWPGSVAAPAFGGA